MPRLQDLDQNTVFNNPDLPEDALSSKQFSTLIEIISEGQIEGSVSASKAGVTDKTSDAYLNHFLKDVFLNGTQVLQEAADVSSPPDSAFNFKSVEFDFRDGSSSQTKINGVRNIERTTVNGLTVTTSNPREETITDTSIETVRITVQFQALQTFEDNGNISGAEVQLQIKTVQNDGTNTIHITDVVKGRASNAYNRDYEFDLPTNASFPVVVRVERITADSTDTKLQNAFKFMTMTELLKAPQTYPNTAHIALRIDSEQFPRIPRRTFRIRGIKVKIPHNATVDLSNGRITYSGTFNGTFKTDPEWTSDPAWILFNLLTNDRYGAGISESNLNQYSFYSVSEYCNELVNDGQNGQEPRFQTNINITTAKEAFNVINELCSVFRGIAYFGAGTIEVANDQPATSKYLFNLSNVTEQGFTYFGSSRKARHTVINVAYFDMETQEIDYETVQAEQTTRDKYGSVVKTVRAMGTTSRVQAQRLGKWLLYNEQNSGETCSFTTSIDAGVIVRPHDIISIQDPMKSGVRRGGRISASSTPTTTQIVVDDTANTDIPTVSASPTLSVVLPDGSVSTRNVSSVSGSTITVSSAFTNSSGQAAAPNPNSVYIFETSTLQTTEWRVLTVKENKDTTFTITALLHDPNKYAAVEDGEVLPTRSISTLTEIKQPPAQMTFQEKIVAVNNKAISKIIVSWQPVVGATSYQFQYRRNNENYVNITTTSNDYVIENGDVGTYDFRIFSINALGVPSVTPLEDQFIAAGKTAAPQDVQGLTLEPIDGKLVRLKWDKTTEIDVIHGGFTHIRHSPATSGADFGSAQDLIQAVSGATTEVTVPALVGTYILKYTDDLGNFSENDATITISIPSQLTSLSIIQQRENPNFTGTKTNTTVSSSKLKLDTLTATSTGTYEFASVVDLGASFTLGLQRVITSLGVNTSDLLDSRSGNVDDYDSWDGSVVNQTNCKVSVATSLDNSTFTDFQDFSQANFVGRYYKFKSTLSSTNIGQNIEVSVLGFDAFIELRTETSASNSATSNGVIASGTSNSGKDISFVNNFFTGTSAIGGSTSAYLPSIQVVPTNMGANETYTITSISGSGFNVKFTDSGGSVINRNFTFTATGFGKSS